MYTQASQQGFVSIALEIKKYIHSVEKEI